MSFISKALSFDPIIGGMFQNKPDYAGQAQSQQNKKQQAITQGTNAINQAFSGFNPQFYQNYQQAYQNYAMPQVAQQYRDTAAPIGFNLANRNLTGGTYGQKQWGDLSRTTNQAKQQVVDTGIQGSQALQQQIQNQQNTLLSNLYASADPANAAQQALAVASQYGGPSTFAPVANMFGNLLNTYVSGQAMNAYRPQTAIQTVSPYQGLYGGGLPSSYQSTPGY